MLSRWILFQNQTPFQLKSVLDQQRRHSRCKFRSHFSVRFNPKTTTTSNLFSMSSSMKNLTVLVAAALLAVAIIGAKLQVEAASTRGAAMEYLLDGMNENLDIERDATSDRVYDGFLLELKRCLNGGGSSHTIMRREASAGPSSMPRQGGSPIRTVMRWGK